MGGANRGGAAAVRGRAAGDGRLDLKALRMAVHGWRLGNPLVYKPGVPDLVAIARELAAAGAAAGTLVVGGPDIADGAAQGGGAPEGHDDVEVVLILRPPLPRTPVRAAAERAVAESARAVLPVNDSEYAARDGEGLYRVSVEEQAGVTYLGLRLALGRLRAAGLADGGEQAERFFARPDWREVFLARALHALEGHLTEAS